MRTLNILYSPGVFNVFEFEFFFSNNQVTVIRPMVLKFVTRIYNVLSKFLFDTDCLIFRKKSSLI